MDAGYHNLDSLCLCTQQPTPETPPAPLVPGVGPALSACPSWHPNQHSCKALIIEAYAMKHGGRELRFQWQFRCFSPFQRLSWTSHPVHRGGFCTPPNAGHSPSSELAVSASVGSETTGILGMVPRCHKTLLLMEKEVCCSLKKNKSLTLYETCAVVAPLTPCESVWVGK